MLCAASVTGVCLALWLVSHMQRRFQDYGPITLSSPDREGHLVSLLDIARLPVAPRQEDVAAILGPWMFGDSLIYKCPAKEGGFYVFSFVPTHEVPGDPLALEDNGPRLVAIMKVDSLDDVLAGRYGIYVYPAALAGKSCSGFSKMAID